MGYRFNSLEKSCRYSVGIGRVLSNRLDILAKETRCAFSDFPRVRIFSRSALSPEDMSAALECFGVDFKDISWPGSICSNWCEQH